MSQENDDWEARSDLLRKLKEVMDLLAAEQSHDRWHHAEANPAKLLKEILDRKRSAVAAMILQCKEFQTDTLVFLRAFVLLLETVAGASTHGEKAARLRGLMELVESAAGKIRAKQFREYQSWSFAMSEDVFRCDYPVRNWIDRAREAEARAEAAEQEAAKIRETWAPKPSVQSPNLPIPTKPEEVPF